MAVARPFSIPPEEHGNCGGWSDDQARSSSHQGVRKLSVAVQKRQQSVQRVEMSCGGHVHFSVVGWSRWALAAHVKRSRDVHLKLCAPDITRSGTAKDH